MKRLDWYIARHYLGSSRGGFLSLITWIALGGVTVGVTALVVVIAVMQGMQEDLRAKILESSAHVTVLQMGRSLRLHDYEEVLESVMAVDGVVGAAPFALSDISVTKVGPAGSDNYQAEHEKRKVNLLRATSVCCYTAREYFSGIEVSHRRSESFIQRCLTFGRSCRRPN